MGRVAGFNVLRRGLNRAAQRLDCTGQSLVCSPQSFDSLDETLHNLVTLDGHSHTLINQALEHDMNSPMVLVAAALEGIKRGSISPANLADVWSRLSDLQANGKHSYPTCLYLIITHIPTFPICNIEKLSPREHLLAAGALALHKEQHFKAANIFESILQHNQRDTLALRLCSEAYLQSGSSYHSLGCALRYRGSQMCAPSLVPTVQGIIAMGYAEASRNTEAEETAMRAIGMSRHKDAGALCALMSSQYFRGKSSEIIALVDEHKAAPKDHKYSNQLWQLYLGMGYVMRGNCSGGFKAALGCMEKYVEDDVPIPPQVTLYQSFLLWHVLLHITPNNILPLDTLCGLLEKGLENISVGSHMHMYVNTIILACRYKAIQTDNLDALILYRRHQALGESYVTSQNDDGFKISSLFRSVPPSASSLPNIQDIDKHFVDKDKLLSEAASKLQRWLKELDQVQPIHSSISFPELEGVVVHLPYIMSQHTAEQHSQTVKNICKAFVHFSLNEYEQANQLLLPGYTRRFDSIGLNAVQRDIVAETFLSR
ncbi:hypothetical protein EON65_14575 [archaeon]|nr:MAG: hypothetical protein EON65_14575 [archaeon]